MPSKNLLLYGASDSDSDILYASGFNAPDPFCWFRAGERTCLVASDLELGRARREARVDEVLSLSAAATSARKRLGRPPRPADVVAEALRSRRVRRAAVPASFPLGMAEALRASGIRLDVRPAPFLPERVVKTPAELREIRRCQRATERAVQRAFERLRRARVRGRRIVEKGRALTAEDIKRTIDVALMEDGCVARHTIVACGEHAVDPHDTGSGPLLPHVPIVFDVFPRSATGYFSDMSRTVVKGKPSDAVRRLHAAVLDGQTLGIRSVRAGANGKDIHGAIHARFRALGYETGPREGGMQGFFHGTGHGVGLDIHEAPRIGGVDDLLPAGAVVTVEPGLYYPGVGGVRIEDMVLVRENGCTNLTRFPKGLDL